MINKRSTLLTLSLLTSIFFIKGCFSPKIIAQEEALFEQEVKNNNKVTKHNLNVNGNNLFYAASGDPLKPALIIIHGTPGSWEQYARYLLNDSMLKRFYMIVIDRPGWGESHLVGNKQIATFSDQAKIISALALKLKEKSQGQAVLLMGHSLGASLAPKVAIDFPEAIDGMLLFAGSLDPALSGPRWYNKVAALPGFNAIIGDAMRRSNQEILALKDEMVSVANDWKKIRAKTIIVQGEKDSLVYPENIQYAENVLRDKKTLIVQLKDEGHLFPMTKREEVVAWATCLLDGLKSQTLKCDSNTNK